MGRYGLALGARLKYILSTRPLVRGNFLQPNLFAMYVGQSANNVFHVRGEP
jgi:hypothetical protein